MYRGIEHTVRCTGCRHSFSWYYTSSHPLMSEGLADCPICLTQRRVFVTNRDNLTPRPVIVRRKLP